MQAIRSIGLCLLAFVTIRCSQDQSVETLPELSPIPETARIIFHEDNYIYVMDEEGNHVTQITFDNPYVLEHVALSHDKTKVIANHFADPSRGGQSSRLLLYDLMQRTVTHLLPEFEMAGNGGVDWDHKGNIYFAGVAELPFPAAKTPEEFQANAGANDIYRVKFDGTDLQNVTHTIERGEADVSVSSDGRFISYMATNIVDVDSTFTEIWIRKTDGTSPELLFVGGRDRVSSVHDPEISPSGDYIVFSQVNNNVSPVFPDDPLANTAHDIVKCNVGRDNHVMTLTQAGPISIIPDWRNDKILYLEITDKTSPPHAGLAIIDQDGTGYKLIRNGANVGKWIPD